MAKIALATPWPPALLPRSLRLPGSRSTRSAEFVAVVVAFVGVLWGREVGRRKLLAGKNVHDRRTTREVRRVCDRMPTVVADRQPCIYGASNSTRWTREEEAT